MIGGDNYADDIVMAFEEWMMDFGDDYYGEFNAYDWWYEELEALNIIITEDSFVYLEMYLNSEDSNIAFLEDVLGMIDYPSDATEFQMVIDGMVDDFMMDMEEEDEEDDDDFGWW
jgi:hypothetical protein